MTIIKYIGENKFSISKNLNNCCEHLSKVVSYLSNKSIPSDLSELNNVITQTTAIERVINTNKEKFLKACQSLNDKESDIKSRIGQLEYFNINQFLYQNGSIVLVSAFGDSADLSFLSQYSNDEKWSNYYGKTVDKLNSELDDLNEMVNKKLTKEEYQRLRKQYPYLQFDYNPLTGKARLLSPDEVEKLVKDAADHGSINLTDMSKYKREYEKWFKDTYGYSYDQYSKKVYDLSKDISNLDSAKYQLDNVTIPLKPYTQIEDSKAYHDYWKNNYGVSVNNLIKNYAYMNKVNEEFGTTEYLNAALLDKMKYMSEDEKKMYCYLYSTKGQKEANKYLNDINDILNREEGDYKKERFFTLIAKKDENGKPITQTVTDDYGNEYEQYVINNNIGTYLITAAQGLGIGVNNFGEGFENLFNKTGKITANQYAQMYITNGLYNAKDHGQNVDAILTDLEIATSIGNMLPSVAASFALSFLFPPAAVGINVGSIAGSGLMGISAAGNAKNQALLSGCDETTALTYGVFNGASEALLGHFLGGITGLSKVSKGFVMDLFSEGLEEFTQEYVDAGLRAGLMHEKFDISQVTEDALKSFTYGAITSGIMNGFSAPINIVMDNQLISITADRYLAGYEASKGKVDAFKAYLKEQRASGNIKISEYGEIEIPENKTEASSGSINIPTQNSDSNVIPISSIPGFSNNLTQINVGAGTVIDFNEIINNLREKANVSPSGKQEYVSPTLTAEAVALVEDIANNSNQPDSTSKSSRSIISNAFEKLRQKLSGNNSGVTNISEEQVNRTVDPVHGFQLNESDFNDSIKKYFARMGTDAESKSNEINGIGYMSESTGKYLVELTKDDNYDIYIKHINSKDLSSINKEGIRCNGRGFGVGMNSVPKTIEDVDLSATVYSGVDGYRTIGYVKQAANGQSEGSNIIDGVLIIKVPKGTPIENMLYWNNEGGGCFCIDPKYNDSYISVDKNCTVGEPILIDHDVTILDEDIQGIDAETGERVAFNNNADNSPSTNIEEIINTESDKIKNDVEQVSDIENQVVTDNNADASLDYTFSINDGKNTAKLITIDALIEPIKNQALYQKLSTNPLDTVIGDLTVEEYLLGIKELLDAISKNDFDLNLTDSDIQKFSSLVSRIEQQNPNNIINNQTNTPNLSVEEIITNPRNNSLFQAFLDFDNNKSIFGNKSREEYIEDISEYLMKNRFSIHDLNWAYYLEIDGLRENLLTMSYIQDILSNTIFDEEMSYLLNKYDSVYEVVDKRTKLFHEYAKKVMSGEYSFIEARFDDIFKAYTFMNDVQLSESFKQNLVSIMKSKSYALDIYKNNPENMTKQELHDLIEFLNIEEMLISNGMDLQRSLSDKEYSSLYNYMNKLLLEKPLSIDSNHFEDYVYSYAKYYIKSKGYNVDFNFVTNSDFDGQYRAFTQEINLRIESVRQKSFVYVLETIFHEVVHHEQYLENHSSYNNSVNVSMFSLIFNIDEILLREIGYEEYYKYNYENIQMEIDARYNAAVRLAEYLKEISPSLYEELKTTLEERIIKEKSLYELNGNEAIYEELLLNRDMILDRLVKEKPLLLKQNPILSYIYNSDGTRKTTVEIMEYMNTNNLDSKTIDMLNYWMRVSKFSLSSMIREVCMLYANPSYIYEDIDAKITETMISESNNFNDNNFINRMNEYVDQNVTVGYLTAEQAETIKQTLQNKYNGLQNNVNDSSLFNFINSDVQDQGVYNQSDLDSSTIQESISNGNNDTSSSPANVFDQFNQQNITIPIILPYILAALKDTNFFEVLRTVDLNALYGDYTVEDYLVGVKDLVEASKKNNIDLGLTETERSNLDVLYNRAINELNEDITIN